MSCNVYKVLSVLACVVEAYSFVPWILNVFPPKKSVVLAVSNLSQERQSCILTLHTRDGMYGSLKVARSCGFYFIFFQRAGHFWMVSVILALGINTFTGTWKLWPWKQYLHKIKDRNRFIYEDRGTDVCGKIRTDGQAGQEYQRSLLADMWIGLTASILFRTWSDVRDSRSMTCMWDWREWSRQPVIPGGSDLQDLSFRQWRLVNW